MCPATTYWYDCMVLLITFIMVAQKHYSYIFWILPRAICGCVCILVFLCKYNIILLFLFFAFHYRKFEIIKVGWFLSGTRFFCGNSVLWVVAYFVSVLNLNTLWRADASPLKYIVEYHHCSLFNFDILSILLNRAYLLLI